MTEKTPGELGVAVRVRPFSSEDRERCLAVLDSNVPDYFGPGERTGFESFLDDLPGPYLVLEGEDGEVVGCGGYSLADEGRADLCWGMIRRAEHGRGLGRHLTEVRVRQALRSPGVRQVALSTSQHTTGFYQRLGFRVVTVEPDGFGPGLDRCDMRLGADADG